jgi:hypothetical protein
VTACLRPDAVFDASAKRAAHGALWGPSAPTG